MCISNMFEARYDHFPTKSHVLATLRNVIINVCTHLETKKDFWEVEDA